MNGGYARWQSQYLKKLRVPRISSISPNMASDLLEAYENWNFESINQITDQIIRTQQSINMEVQKTPKQLSFVFDF